jgi:phage terminase large subunit-like protein
VLIDELWLFGKRANAESMLREATGGLIARPEGCVIYLSTQSDEPPAGVFKDKLNYARAVRDGDVVDPKFLPVIYEFPKAMIEAKDYEKSEHWHITNPNMGLSVNHAYLEREVMKAQHSENREGSLRDVYAKHMNVEIGMNLRGDRWPGADYWQQAQHATPVTLETLIAESEVITVGIDGGGLDDLLGASALGRSKREYEVTIEAHYNEAGEFVPTQKRKVKKWLAWTYAWAHPSVLERRKDVAPRLKDFANAGEMTLVDVIGQDTEELASMVGLIEESGLLFQVGLDPAAIGGILDALTAVGVPEDKCVTVNQGWRLAGSIKTAERKLAEHVLVHSGTALMNWCVGNAKVKVVGNAIVVTKQVSGTAKIDPLIALFNAVSLMALNPPAQTPEYDFSLMTIGG